MKDFKTWYSELISDQRWFEQASLYHKPETFEQVANKVYVNGLADSKAFFVCPMREHRQHVYNKVSKLPHDKVKKQWFDVPEPKKEPVMEVHRSEEEIQQKLAEWREAIEANPPIKRIAPISKKEIFENGQVDLPKIKPYPSTKESEVIKHALHLEYLKQNYDARTKFRLACWVPEDDWLKQLEED